MKERVKYIDSLKGIAILLMVMGHVIAWQFSDWQVALNDEPRNTMLVWRLIYSFHMPLLMFCSGLVALHVKEYTWNVIGQTLWKRVCTLLLPFFVTGSIRYFTQGGYFLDYWYLWMLFQFIIVVMVIDGMCSLIPKIGRLISSCFIVVSALIVHVFYSRFLAYQELPFINIGQWSLYPYFCMGMICARYDLCAKWFSKNWVYTLALLVFGFLTYWITICGNYFPKQSQTGCLLPISAIIFLVYLFKNGLSETSRPVQWLQDLGRHSLEIYIIHFFFLFRMHRIGEFVMQQAHILGGGRTIFFVQVTSSFIASVVIIVLCYIVMNMINKSKVLSQIFLGRKSER